MQLLRRRFSSYLLKDSLSSLPLQSRRRLLIVVKGGNNRSSSPGAPGSLGDFGARAGSYFLPSAALRASAVTSFLSVLALLLGYAEEQKAEGY